MARYRKLVRELAARVREQPTGFAADQRRDLAWAIVESDMLRHHVCRRLSGRLDGIDGDHNASEGSVDKLLMTQVEQSVGHASLAIGGTAVDGGDGMARVSVNKTDKQALDRAAARTASRTDIDPTTGAELGAGPGGGVLEMERKP